MKNGLLSVVVACTNMVMLVIYLVWFIVHGIICTIVLFIGEICWSISSLSGTLLYKLKNNRRK